MTSVARTAQTLLIAASSMLFAAFTSAMVVRRGLSGDWVAPALPAWIWPTLLLAPLASLLIHKQQVKPAIAVGALLIAAQCALLANLQMGVIGEAFCTVLIAAHTVHTVAGILALARFGAGAAIFWHFVGILWIYVLFLFGVWA